MTVHESTAKMSRTPVLEGTPVSMPMSVLLVVQVRVPKGEGTVVFVPVDLTVPFVVPGTCSMLRVPAASRVGVPLVQLLELRVETGPLTVVPVNGLDVLHFKVDALHVLARNPAVSVSSHELELSVASIVTELVCAAPPFSIVVAIALLANNAIEAIADTRISPKVFGFMILLS
jgi:hypothetical protein